MHSIEKYNYIVNVGETPDRLYPHLAAYSKKNALYNAKKLESEYKYVEIVYMPESKPNVNKVVYRSRTFNMLGGMCV